MGGGGAGSSNGTQNQYNNQTYNYSGGTISLDNLLGTLNYKSDSASVDNSKRNYFETTSANKNSAENSTTQKGGDGGSSAISLGYSTGAGGGGAGGDASAGNTSGGVTSNLTQGIPSYVLYIGAGVAGVYFLSKMKRKKGR